MTGVTVGFDPERVSTFAPGTYSADVFFRNASNAAGDAQRRVTLTIEAPAPLAVSPSTGFASSGPEGGPFSPPSGDYVLTNPGSSPLRWSARTNQPWLRVSATSGQLAAGDQTTVTVALDPIVANGLAGGNYTAAVSFHDDTNGVSHVRDADLVVFTSSPGGGMTASSLHQFGITWTFDREYEVGQYANGDWYVIGPVRIVRIEPGSSEVFGRTMHGSMINPSPMDPIFAAFTVQGFDSSMYGQNNRPELYDPSMNVALGVSPAHPLRRADPLLARLLDQHAGGRDRPSARDRRRC